MALHSAHTMLLGWRRPLLAGVVGLWLFAAGVLPEASAQRVQAFAEPDTVSIGERFELAIVAEHNFLMDALLPIYDTEDPGDSGERAVRLGDVEILSEKRRGGGYLGRDRPGIRADTVVFEATTFALDTAHVPAIAVPFVAGGDTVTAASRPFTIAVASHLPPDASDVRDLAPLAPFPQTWWPWVMMALLAVLLASAAAWLFRRWHNAEPAPTAEPAPRPAPPSPHEVASHRLRRLVHETTFDDPTQLKPYYVELVDIMRSYLHERLSIRAHEMTTSELIREIRLRSYGGFLPEEVDPRMRTLLSQADLIKFADDRTGPETARAAADEAQALLDTLESNLPTHTHPATNRPLTES